MSQRMIVFTFVSTLDDMSILVLVVESDDSIRANTMKIVEASTLHVVSRPSLESALRLLSCINFDIVVTGVSASSANITAFVNAAKAMQPCLQIISSQNFETRKSYIDSVDMYLMAPLLSSELRHALHIATAKDSVLKRLKDSCALPGTLTALQSSIMPLPSAAPQPDHFFHC